MKKPIQTVMVILLFPLWMPITIALLTWVIASDITEIIIDKIDQE